MPGRRGSTWIQRPAVLAIILALAGCGSPQSPPVPDALAPLPDPIHDERSVVAGVTPANIEPAGPCGPTTACVDHAFTLPRFAVIRADVAWTNPTGGMALELLRAGERVSYDEARDTTVVLRKTLEAEPGDYVLRVHPNAMVNDRYVLDVTFSEIVPLQARPADAPRVAEASAAIATKMADIPCEATTVDPVTTSDNLVQLAEVGYVEGRRGELDARDGWLVVHVLEGGGFDLIDVSDPAAPLHRERYLPDGSGQSWDVKWMPDGKTVVVGNDLSIDLVDASAFLEGDPDASFNVLHTWDYESAGPTDRSGMTGMHMLTPARIGDSDWVFLATQGNAGVAVLKLDDEARTLSFAGRIGNDAFSGSIDGPHDTSFIVDEFTGDPILYVANGRPGWRAFDVSDPLAPKELAHVVNLFGDAFTHSVVAQRVGDRRLVAVSEEGRGSVVTVYDATDWSLPVVVGTWVMRDRDPLASAHNMQIVDGLLYLAHYRAGAFVFDLRELGTTPAIMEPIAHFEPPRPTGSLVPTAYEYNIWDVVIHRGILYASDMDAGTYVLGFGCLTPGDEALSSRN